MKQTNNSSVAEVIESSLNGFLAQTWQWNHFPTFGSMVSVDTGKRLLCGVIYQVQTGSMDPVRYPFPYQKTEVELIAEQPQIFEFLKTTFNTLIIGYQEKGSFFYVSAPEPAKIHSFINPMTPNLCKQFFYQHRYLHLLFGLQNQLGNIDELMLALIKQQADLGIMHREAIRTFAHQFCLLTGNDYRRLKLFLQRVEPLLN